jgi:hypothetical protein
MEIDVGKVFGGKFTLFTLQPLQGIRLCNRARMDLGPIIESEISPLWNPTKKVAGISPVLC